MSFEIPKAAYDWLIERPLSKVSIAPLALLINIPRSQQRIYAAVLLGTIQDIESINALNERLKLEKDQAVIDAITNSLKKLGH